MSSETLEMVSSLVKGWYGEEQFTLSAMYQIPYINTLKGKRFVSKGDYIITDIKGQRYPCEAEVFSETYELLEV